MEDCLKVEFLTPLRLEKNGNWTVLENFVYSIDGEIGFVPAGTETDLDSVPRLPFAYWLLKGRAKKSAVLHDWLYKQQVGREYADDVLWAGMETEGVNLIWKRLIYTGVRIGGWKAYGKKDKPIEEVPPP